MRKEFGKWLMDVAKYIATAVILSSVFGEAEAWVIYFVGGLSVVIALACGLILSSDNPNKFLNRILKNRKNNSK